MVVGRRLPWGFPSCSMPLGNGPLGVGPIRSVYVPVRDGVKIALDIVLPTGASTRKFPTALTMTRYWRAKMGAGPDHDEQLFASHGFAVIAGDVRGTGASTGVWPHHRSRAETLDFGEIIDWIVRQPWSDGSVIGFGTSYSANTADWMAERHRSALKAIIPRFADYDPYLDLYFPGGVPNAYMGRTWGLLVKNLDVSPGVRLVNNDTAQLARAIGARRDVPSVWEALRQITFRDDRPADWHGDSMDDWAISRYAAAVSASGTPTQTWAGWMDAGTAAGAIHRFQAQSNPMRVFLGAWSHAGLHNASPYAKPGDAPDPPYAAQLAEDLCFAKQPSTDRVIHYYTMGSEQWKTTREWPPAGFQNTPWYLASARGLAAQQPSPGQDRYTVDFTATTGKMNRWATNNGAGPVDYGDRAEPDAKLLTYTSEPLDADIEITGTAVAHLFVTSTHDDGNFFVYLEDVAPDGVVRYVTEGELRAIQRKGTFRRADAAPLIPGQVAELTFPLMPVSVLIRRGHRIRVAVAGADADTFTRVPTTGDPTIAVLWGAEHPSRVELPSMRG